MKTGTVMRAVAVASVLASLEPAAFIGVRAQSLGDQLHRRAVRELAAGKLLVAARGLKDPNFASTVVLLADFTKEGAMGLIVNRPTKITLSRLFPQFEQSPGGAAAAFLGGPVLAPGVVALLRSKATPSDTRRIMGDVYLVSSRNVLEQQVTGGAGPSRFRVYVGYSGWGAGQLEEETASGAWHVLEGDADVIFDSDSESTWQRQIQKTEGLSARSAGVHADGVAAN